MNRRQLLSVAALAFVVPLPARAGGLPHVKYSRDAYEKALSSGEPLLLDFFAEW